MAIADHLHELTVGAVAAAVDADEDCGHREGDGSETSEDERRHSTIDFTM